MSRKNDPQAAKLRFYPTSKADFFSTLRKNVDNYFKENEISKYGNHHFAIKTAAMLGLYIIPFVLILTGYFSIWVMLFFTFLIGIGKAGIGMCVMHDANHGSAYPSKTINKILGNTMYLLGASTFAWKIQHNVLHHTYTNIYDMDEDIDSKFIIRLSPYAELKKFHKYQHIYALPLYCFLTLAVLVKDFTQVISYTSKNFQFKAKTTQFKEVTILILTKLAYLGCVLLLPYLLLDITVWQLAIGFCVAHFTTGIILSVVFQLAHVVENTEHHQVLDNEDNLENTWAAHQLHTTADFARNNRLLSWYVGGLNFQIEHHLFPNICHVHYKAISDIVKNTAQQFNLPYNEMPTFRSAIKSHLKTLKQLGQVELQSTPA
ncbi:acyl-CoA desaturase [uncultured Microscilla sp.]|uniref:fatty acid desaturase family protein n=1 Tax=uncultured Microscilla sp. TaxID=432653 RepID=UPI0026082880|nr:acyl-CoA desaturase [uncultured Microscilla sp.]